MPQHDNSGAESHPDEGASIDASLLERVRAGDSESWSRLAEICGPLIYRWCRLSGLQGEDAADVSQEVFAGMAARVAQFRSGGPGASFRGWLWGITRHKIADHFRRMETAPHARGGTTAQQMLAQIPEEPPVDSRSAHDPDGQGAWQRRAVETVRAGVEDKTWRAFWRVAIDGQPVTEVAEELDMGVKAVYAAKYRVLHRLRVELDGLFEALETPDDSG